MGGCYARAEQLCLCFAMRSVRLMEPVLICPLFVATAMSAIVVSSVSTDSLLTASAPACILYIKSSAILRGFHRAGCPICSRARPAYRSTATLRS